MASYEDDHNVRGSATSKHPSRQRIDLTNFFAALNLSNSAGEGGEHDEAPFRSLAAAFRGLPDTPVMEGLVQQLLSEAQDPSAKVKGVSDSFLDGLERVPKKQLKKVHSEMILKDPYPLVVRLPCHTTHVFDLECVQPWLKLHSTCPLDRIDFLEKKKEPVLPIVDDEEEEEEWDENYG